MDPIILAGTGNFPLATAIAKELALSLGKCPLTRSPDGELRVEVHKVRGRDVFLVQPTAPPPDTNLVELLFMADACGAQTQIT